MNNYKDILDYALNLLEHDQPFSAMHYLEEAMYKLKHVSSPEEWNHQCRLCRKHRIANYLYQDPFTKWSYDKPRGYPGDAVLMDYIYQHHSVQQYIDEATPLGKKLYQYSINTPATRAVRYRLIYVANLIDDLADKLGAIDVLSLACGHVRETEISNAMKLGKLKRFIALDQDEKTVATVSSLYSGKIQAKVISARELITGKFDWFGSGFDLIYSVGLIDYLEDRVSQNLIKRLFAMLNPCGYLFIPNFKPSIIDSGYMEAFMDWKLIYRDNDDMRNLAELLPIQEIDKIDTSSSDPDNNIVLMLIKKK